jgi:hypothetical protein
MPTGIANILYGLTGQPDPARQIAELLSGSTAQQGGVGPQGPVPPTQQPAPPATPGAPQSGGPQQPRALESSPDMAGSYQQLAQPNLMQLYLQLDARNRASEGINKGLALIAANYAGNPVSMRAIMDSVNGGGADAGSTVGNLMSLYSQQQNMSAQREMLAASPEIAQRTGLPLAVVQARIMAGGGADLVKDMETPEIGRNYDWARRTYSASHPNASADEIDEGAQNILLGVGGTGGDALTKSYRIEKLIFQRNNPGQPLPWGNDDPMAFASWKNRQDALATDQQEAAQKLHSGYAQNITTLRGNIGGIIGLKPGGDPNNPDDYDQDRMALLKNALSKPGAQAYLSGDPTDWRTQAKGIALEPEEKKLLDDIRDTTDKNQLFGSLNARAPKRGVSDVAAIGTGLARMQNVRQGFDSFMDGAKKTITAADTALGNGFGAAGEAENAPDYTKPLIDDAYLPGGSMYPYGKKPAPMTSDQIAQATAKIKSAADPEGERQILIKAARANNIDASPLQQMRL